MSVEWDEKKLLGTPNVTVPFRSQRLNATRWTAAWWALATTKALTAVIGECCIMVLTR